MGQQDAVLASPSEARPFLTAEWRQLVMVNFAVDPAILEPRVPRGTRLDSWNGVTLVSVVGFLFLRTRVMGVAIPRHRDFEELNLRFYVAREHPDGLRRGGWSEVGLTAAGEPSLPAEGSEEEFVTEHYWGYATERNGATLEYRVEHPRWRVWRATHARLACDVSDLYGAEFAAALSASPTSAFLAEGSEIVVRRGRRIAERAIFPAVRTTGD